MGHFLLLFQQVSLFLAKKATGHDFSSLSLSLSPSRVYRGEPDVSQFSYRRIWNLKRSQGRRHDAAVILLISDNSLCRRFRALCFLPALRGARTLNLVSPRCESHDIARMKDVGSERFRNALSPVRDFRVSFFRSNLSLLAWRWSEEANRFSAPRTNFSTFVTTRNHANCQLQAVIRKAK